MSKPESAGTALDNGSTAPGLRASTEKGGCGRAHSAEPHDSHTHQSPRRYYVNAVTNRDDQQDGLPALRAAWIAERDDTEELPDFSSEFCRRRAADPELSALRFELGRKPRRAKPGMNTDLMQ